jgi:hypothetical protein
MVAGWWRDAPPPLANLTAGFPAHWPADSSTFNYHEEALQEIGGSGYQVLAYIHLMTYPEAEAWMQIIKRSLTHFIAYGAAVAWAGGYECFALYTPGSEFLGCYAAYAQGAGLLCRGGLDDPIAYISDDPRLVERLNRTIADQCGNVVKREQKRGSPLL